MMTWPDERSRQDPWCFRERRRRHRSRRPTESWPSNTIPTSPATTRSNTDASKTSTRRMRVPATGRNARNMTASHAPVRTGRDAGGVRSRGVCPSLRWRAGFCAASAPSGVDFSDGAATSTSGDIFSSLFGGGDAGRPSTGRWGGQREPVEPWRRYASAQLPISLRGSGAGHDSHDPYRERQHGRDRRSRRASTRGGRLRVPGQGAAGAGQVGAPATCIWTSEVRPDPTLRRDGADIEMSLPITVAEAPLGTKVEVPTVEGPVTVSDSARHLERRQAPPARQGNQAAGRYPRRPVLPDRDCRAKD